MLHSTFYTFILTSKLWWNHVVNIEKSSTDQNLLLNSIYLSTISIYFESFIRIIIHIIARTTEPGQEIWQSVMAKSGKLSRHWTHPEFLRFFLPPFLSLSAPQGDSGALYIVIYFKIFHFTLVACMLGRNSNVYIGKKIFKILSPVWNCHARVKYWKDWASLRTTEVVAHTSHTENLF